MAIKVQKVALLEVFHRTTERKFIEKLVTCLTDLQSDK